jgi:putative transposase
VYNIGFHLIWCPKYRRNVLENEIEGRLKELLYNKAEEIGVTIEKMEVMPDHVHLFVKTTPTMSPHWIVQQLKGYTSRILRQEYSELRTRLPTLWTRSYYCESVGHISEATVKKYIEEQKNK